MVNILYFMGLVNTIGTSHEEMALPENVTDVQGMVDLLEARGETYQQALQGGARVQITINKRFVELTDALRDRDEIAFFPKS